MKAAGIAAKKMEYLKAIWYKAVWNMSFNGMTVALDTTTKELVSDPDAVRLIKALMIEVIDGARACGVEDINHELADKVIENTRTMPPYLPIEEARKAGCEMPRLSMLESELKFKERNR